METPRVTDASFWLGEDPRLLEPGAGGLAQWAAGQAELAGHVLFLTSGSSGAAKWVALSREALRCSAEAVNAHLRVRADDVWGLALPERHVGGFGVLARGFFAGVEVARFVGKWQPQGFRDWLEAADVSLVSLVPTQLVDLVAAALTAPRRLRVVVAGGGAVGNELGEAARALGWPVLASFGMTEAGSQIATAPLEQLGEGFSAAPLPLLGPWQARVDHDGCLAVRGEALFSGYVVGVDGGWSFLPRSGEWFQTTDRVALGTAGLTPMGRADRRVKVLGELVDLDEIERAIAQTALPDVWKIIDLPDPRRGCRLVLVSEAVPPSAAMRAALAAYQAHASGPTRLAGTAVVAAFPRGELGKLQMAQLRLLAEPQEAVKPWPDIQG
jgi:O-succinylbenzoic acid--CoA ligase